MGMRRSPLVGLVFLLALAGCSNDAGRPAPTGVAPATSSPATSPPAASPAPSPVGGPTRIDIGGGQTYGLVATADAVWATSFDASSAVRIDPTTNAVTATVTVPGGATSIIDDKDSLWVAG